VISQLEGKDYLEDTLIVIKDLTISPPSGDRYYVTVHRINEDTRKNKYKDMLN
jgi:hypothetical protein